MILSTKLNDPVLWKNGIVPEEFMDESEAKIRAEEIDTQQLIDEDEQKKKIWYDDMGNAHEEISWEDEDDKQTHIKLNEEVDEEMEVKADLFRKYDFDPDGSKQEEFCN